jgi:uncharacterized protein YndB with AHSA1/START domain
MSKPKFVYVTYIRSTPEKVWEALTDQQMIRKYWFGMTAECDWKPGSPWRLKFEDGRTAARPHGRHGQNSGGRSA